MVLGLSQGTQTAYSQPFSIQGNGPLRVGDSASSSFPLSVSSPGTTRSSTPLATTSSSQILSSWSRQSRTTPYTTVTPTSLATTSSVPANEPSQHALQVGAIVAISITVPLSICLLVALLWLYARRRRKISRVESKVKGILSRQNTRNSSTQSLWDKKYVDIISEGAVVPSISPITEQTQHSYYQVNHDVLQGSGGGIDEIRIHEPPHHQPGHKMG